MLQESNGGAVRLWWVVGLSCCCLAIAIDTPAPRKLKMGVLKRPEQCDTKSKPGDLLSVYSTGKLHKSNTIFDAKEPSGEPFIFHLGYGEVIQGWDQGLLGMCQGEIRRLVIPSALAFGARGVTPDIPANAALEYDIELAEITRTGDL
eukprot:m.129262 g.129262  ORF g.129262 m.129262 type:complete len:148 (+) comp13668_c0_seq2:245-688(+)